MTSQRLGGFPLKLPDTASQMYKYFPQGTIACFSLRYTDHEHYFVHSEPREAVLTLFFPMFPFDSVNLSSVRFGNRTNHCINHFLICVTCQSSFFDLVHQADICQLAFLASLAYLAPKLKLIRLWT